MAYQKSFSDKETEKFVSFSYDDDESDDDLNYSEPSDIEVASDEDDIPLNILRAKSNIITNDKTILCGKNGLQ